MNRRKTPLILIAIAAVGVAAKPANSGPITFTFDGQVTELIDDNNVLGGVVTVGTVFSGSYTFESTTPDTVPSPLTGAYPFSVSNIIGQIGAVSFAGPMTVDGSISVADNGGVDDSTDLYRVASRVSFLSQSLSFGILLLDNTGTALSSDTLPLDPPELESFQTTSFSIADEALPLFINGNITSLVPEPATLVLLMLGVGAVATQACKRPGHTNYTGRSSQR